MKRNRKEEIPDQDILKRQKTELGSELEANSFKKIKKEILKDQPNDKALLKLLRKADKKVFQITDAEGDTLLHLTIQHTLVKSSLRLISKMQRESLTIKNKKDEIPLHWAIDTGQEEIIETLVKKDRKSILVKDSAGKTPLYWAFERDQSDIVELLLKLNIGSGFTNKLDKEGITILHWALARDHSNIEKLLLNIDSEFTDKRKKEDITILHWAVKEDWVDIIELLLSKNLSLIYKQDINGKTVLHWAVEYDNLNAIEILIKKCCLVSFVSKKDKQGLTATDIAAEAGRKNIIDLVKRHQDQQKHFLKLDDSSDEEESVENYKITDKLKDFIDFSKNNSTNELDFKAITHPNFCLSFITHAIGIYLFYSLQVQEKYYKLKNERLVTSELPTDDIIKEKLGSGIANLYKCCGNRGGPKQNKVKNKALINQYEAKVKSYAGEHNSDIRKSVYNFEKLKNLISKIFSNISLDDEWVNIMTRELFVPRKSLSSFDLNSTDDLDFLAELRLHNRSEKREYKNRQNNDDNAHTVNDTTNHKKQNNSQDKVTKIFINNKYIGDAKIVYDSNFLRSEVVKFEGAECDYHLINYNYAMLSDSAFSYLLFGCEAIKNPAAFIHHKMIIDLIKAGRMDWKDALVDLQMPMAMEGAVMASRILNSDYNDFMPHKYLYDEDYYHLRYRSPKHKKDHALNATMLLEKEVNITCKWLKWIFDENGVDIEVADDIISRCGVDIEASEPIDHEVIYAVWEQVLDSCRQWYPGVLGEVTPDDIL